MATIDEQLNKLPQLRDSPWNINASATQSGRVYATDLAKVVLDPTQVQQTGHFKGAQSLQSGQGQPFMVGYVFGRSQDGNNIFLSNECVQDPSSGQIYALSGHQISKREITSYESIQQGMKSGRSTT